MTPIQTLAWQVIGSASDLGHLLFSERRDLQWLRRHQKLPIINEESGTVCNEGTFAHLAGIAVVCRVLILILRDSDFKEA